LAIQLRIPCLIRALQASWAWALLCYGGYLCPCKRGNRSIGAKALYTQWCFSVHVSIIPSAGRWEFCFLFHFGGVFTCCSKITIQLTNRTHCHLLSPNFLGAAILMSCHRATCPVTSSWLYRTIDGHATSPSHDTVHILLLSAGLLLREGYCIIMAPVTESQFERSRKSLPENSVSGIMAHDSQKQTFHCIVA